MERFYRFLLRRRWLIAAVFAVLCLFGVYSWTRLSIDAYPDIADVCVHVVTQIPGLAAEEIEQQITIPLERALNGLPSLVMLRSKNSFGLSLIFLVFEDGTDDYWARQRVMECIGDVDLPYGAVPELNPLTSPTGEIFRYVLVGDPSVSLRELTDINQWTVIPALRQFILIIRNELRKIVSPAAMNIVSCYAGTCRYISPVVSPKLGITAAKVKNSAIFLNIQ